MASRRALHGVGNEEQLREGVVVDEEPEPAFGRQLGRLDQGLAFHLAQRHPAVIDDALRVGAAAAEADREVPVEVDAQQMVGQREEIVVRIQLVLAPLPPVARRAGGRDHHLVRPALGLQETVRVGQGQDDDVDVVGEVFEDPVVPAVQRQALESSRSIRAWICGVG